MTKVSKVVFVEDVNVESETFDTSAFFAFASWLLSKYGGKSILWRPFSLHENNLNHDTPSAIMQKRINSSGSTDGKLHRGFLLYGPAGTGKSSSVSDCIKALKMHNIWGYSEDQKPIVGTGMLSNLPSSLNV